MNLPSPKKASKPSGTNYFEQSLASYTNTDFLHKPLAPRKSTYHGYMCKGKSCTKRASFNMPREKFPIFCKTCALSTMVNVIREQMDKRNAEPDDNTGLFVYGCPYCGRRATHNYGTEINAAVCSQHKTSDMINVSHRGKKCLTVDCVASARYGKEEVAEFCYSCALKEYETPQLIKKKWGECTFQQCMKRASFGTLEEAKPIRCKVHRELGMVNVNLHKQKQKLEKERKEQKERKQGHKRKRDEEEAEDLPNPVRRTEGGGFYCVTCLRNEKRKRATFHYPGKSTMLFCKKCARKGMVNLNRK